MRLTDGQTDAFLVASPRWHSILRQKKLTAYSKQYRLTTMSKNSKPMNVLTTGH